MTMMQWKARKWSSVILYYGGMGKMNICITSIFKMWIRDKDAMSYVRLLLTNTASSSGVMT